MNKGSLCHITRIKNLDSRVKERRFEEEKNRERCHTRLARRGMCRRRMNLSLRRSVIKSNNKQNQKRKRKMMNQSLQAILGKLWRDNGSRRNKPWRILVL